MKFVTILFILVAYAAGGILIADEASETGLDFPTFNAPEFVAGAFSDCEWYDLGCHAGNIAEAVLLIYGTFLYVIQLLIEFLRYTLAWIVLVFTVMFTGVQDAPWWVNVLLGLPFIAGIGIISYKLIRSGDDSS